MFKIYQISAGWIMGEISDGNKTHFFDNSYLTNFLDDFMLALLTVDGHWPADEGKHKFKTELEPAVEYWVMSKVQDELRIHIKKYVDGDINEDYEEEILICEYHKFLSAFISEMERVLSTYGLIGYRDNWTYEFPVSLFLMLKDINMKTLSYKTLSSEDNCGDEVQVSDYIKERELL